MDNKAKFEVKARTHPNGKTEKAIFIDDKFFDYSIDQFAYNVMRNKGIEYEKQVQEDIVRHFIESVSEFLGRKITMVDVVKGIKTGWI